MACNWVKNYNDRDYVRECYKPVKILIEEAPTARLSTLERLVLTATAN